MKTVDIFETGDRVRSKSYPEFPYVVTSSSRGGWDWSNSLELDPTPLDDDVTVTLKRSDWDKVTLALASTGRNSLIRGKIAEQVDTAK